MNKVILIAFIAFCGASCVHAFVRRDAPVPSSTQEQMKEVSDLLEKMYEREIKSKKGETLSTEDTEELIKKSYLMEQFVHRDAPAAPEDVDSEIAHKLKDNLQKLQLLQLTDITHQMTAYGTKKLSEKDMRTLDKLIDLGAEMNESIIKGTFPQIRDDIEKRLHALLPQRKY